eukprot:gene14650-biopygen9170
MAVLTPLAAQWPAKLAAKRGGAAAKLSASTPLPAKHGGMAAWRHGGMDSCRTGGIGNFDQSSKRSHNNMARATNSSAARPAMRFGEMWHRCIPTVPIAGRDCGRSSAHSQGATSEHTQRARRGVGVLAQGHANAGAGPFPTPPPLRSPSSASSSSLPHGLAIGAIFRGPPHPPPPCAHEAAAPPPPPPNHAEA